jgi:hypothetical protein
MEVLKNNGTFFNDLKRIARVQEVANNTRKPSIANTFQNETTTDKTLISSSSYSRKWQQKLANPFPIKSRFDNGYYSGRNLNVLNTLKINAKTDKPDVITTNPYQFIGFT